MRLVKWLYFLDEDGGMDVLQITEPSDLKCLFGWGEEAEDKALIEQMEELSLGEFIPHRVGVLVRVKPFKKKEFLE